jgi:anti-sigma B factor antagonist
VNVTPRREGLVTVLAVSGEIDGRTAPSFQEQVLGGLAPEGRVLLDLGQVTFLSSAGLRALLLTHREATGRRARLVLIGLSEDLRTTMSATGFLRFFAVRESLADGLAALE